MVTGLELMTMSEVAATPRVDRRLFSLHEEEEVVEVSRHRRQVVYFAASLKIELSDRFIGANMGIYWVPGQYETPWVGPDLFVPRQYPKDPEPRVYLVWEDGPVQFVAEVASERTRRAERRKRERIYRTELQVPEYLYIDLDRHQLELWRLHEGEYRQVEGDGGRLFSEELGLWFGWDPEAAFVRIWTAGGRMLPTVEEREQRLHEAEERAEERGLRLHEAEERAEEKERRLHEAEKRAEEERRLREVAEARAAALAAELERLRGD
jgi:Uma2 family endonuclease